MVQLFNTLWPEKHLILFAKNDFVCSRKQEDSHFFNHRKYFILLYSLRTIPRVESRIGLGRVCAGHPGLQIWTRFNYIYIYIQHDVPIPHAFNTLFQGTLILKLSYFSSKLILCPLLGNVLIQILSMQREWLISSDLPPTPLPLAPPRPPKIKSLRYPSGKLRREFSSPHVLASPHTFLIDTVVWIKTSIGNLCLSCLIARSWTIYAVRKKMSCTVWGAMIKWEYQFVEVVGEF